MIEFGDIGSRPDTMGEDEEGTRETDFHGGSGNQLLREQEQNEFLSIFLLAGKHLCDWPMVMSLNRAWMTSKINNTNFILNKRPRKTSILSYT